MIVAITGGIVFLGFKVTQNPADFGDLAAEKVVLCMHYVAV